MNRAALGHKYILLLSRPEQRRLKHTLIRLIFFLFYAASSPLTPSSASSLDIVHITIYNAYCICIYSFFFMRIHATAIILPN